MHARYCVSFILTLRLTEEEIPGTIRVTLAYRDTLTEGDLDGWQSRDCQSYSGIPGYWDLDGWQSWDSPGTVRVTLSYRDTLTEGDLDGW